MSVLFAAALRILSNVSQKKEPPLVDRDAGPHGVWAAKLAIAIPAARAKRA